jgi:rhamnose transport system permease protein
VRRSYAWDLAVIVALVLFVAIAGQTIEGVGSPRFWRFVMLEVIPVALIALPLALVVITGEIDLSVASVLGLTCTVLGQLWASGCPRSRC